MTDVLVCIKRVPGASGEVLLSDNDQHVDARHVGWTLSAHEECAVELATQVAGATGGTATAVTVGSSDAVEQLRDALAVGCGRAVLVEADTERFGPADVAAAIAEVVRTHDAAGTTYGLVLLGNDAADTGDFQVPVRLAYELSRPIVTGASVARVADGDLVATVRGPYGEETYVVPLPAVAAVLEGGTEPRYPSLRGRMAAKKIEVQVRRPVGEATGSGRIQWHLPPRPPSSTELLGTGPQAAPAVVEVLRRMSLLS